MARGEQIESRIFPNEAIPKTPSYPMLRMLLSLASYKGWPSETWDVSTAFLYARLYGDRDTDLDGQYIYMRPPKVIEKLGLLPEGTI